MKNADFATLVESLSETIDALRRELVSSTTISRLERAEMAEHLAEATKALLAMQEDLERE